MRLINIRHYGPVTSCELGWSVVGRPAWTVHLYVVDGVCIDTGQSRMRRWALDFLKHEDINQIVLTHHHEDHSGNAAFLKSTRNIPVYGHAITVEKMTRRNKILPYQHYMWGASSPLTMQPLPDIITSDSVTLQPIHTPGHSKDHVVFFEEKNGWLFSGDLFLSERIKYFRSDERMKEQIDSLRKISQLDFQSLFCAHNPKPVDGKNRIAAKLRFLETLYGNIRELWLKGLSIDEITAHLPLKESYLIKIICMGNVSMKNMVRSAVKSFNNSPYQ
jgi:glyoxylase-like metal-dependent hydrolase (beta-lactamase superfamily II)